MSAWQTYRKKTTIKARKMDKDFTCSTPEGIMQGRAGDYLAKGAFGEEYPIKREIFESTYELVG